MRFYAACFFVGMAGAVSLLFGLAIASEVLT